MGRTVDQEVHAAFVEFRAKEDDKCLSVQCIYCQQIRAKNTSRQKQHLLECPALRGHNNPHAQPPHPPQQPQSQQQQQQQQQTQQQQTQQQQQQTQQQQAQQQAQQAQQAQQSNGATNGYGPAPGAPGGPGSATGALPSSNGPMMPAGVNPHSSGMQTPMPSLPGRPSLPSQAAPPSAAPPPAPAAQARAHGTPKTSKQPRQSTSSLPAPPLDDVHAAFVEFRAKEEDKCLSVQCIYCQQVRAKNTSRQRQHLLECPTYLNVMKDSIPANNLQHTFPEGDIARSLQLPAPTLELDFRMSIKLNPSVSLGHSIWGQRDWVTFVGGQWAGRWGKGVVLPGGQDSQVIVKELATSMKSSYLLQTSDEPPAFIMVKTNGWMTGAKEVLEKVADPTIADSVNPNTYKYRVNISMETGDERYAFVNTIMWVGSGCRRGSEVILDAFRVN